MATRIRPSNIVKLRHSIELPGNSSGVIMEEVLITPSEGVYQRLEPSGAQRRGHAASDCYWPRR